MSTWIPILTGLLAFVGAIAGHFVAFDLNTAARRREVRRAQIERLAEFVSEDRTWLRDYRNEALFGLGKFAPGHAPFDRAKAIYMLYFRPELSAQWTALLQARHEFEAEMDKGYMERLRLALANKQELSATCLPQADLDVVTGKHPAYYEATLQILIAASQVAQETIPEKSQIARWCADRWTQFRRRFPRMK